MKLFDVNWEYLKRFKICAESKNFSEAAKKIGTTINTISVQLDALEKTTGYTLFKKINSNRSHNLTPQGRKVFDTINLASQYLEESFQNRENRVFYNKSICDIKIFTTPGLATYYIPKLIDCFLEKNSQYRFEVIATGPPIDIEDNDIIIRSDIKNDSDVKKFLLFEISMNLYASRNYIKKYGNPQTIDDLKNHQVLTFSSNNYGNTNWALLSEHGFPIVSKMSSNSIDFLHYMAVKGHGIVELADIYTRSTQLERVLESENSPKFMLYIACKELTLTNIKILKFIDFIKSYH